MDGTGSAAGRIAPFVNAIGTGHGLGEELIDGCASHQALLVIVRDLDRADLCTLTAGLAIFDRYITGLLLNEDFKSSGLAFDFLDSGIGEYFNVPMATCIDQFGGHDAHGAIIGGKGLIQLRHGAPDTKLFFEEIDFQARFGKVEGSLNSPNSSTHHKHCADWFFPG